MKEKIMAKLRVKFAGVPNKLLERIATKMAAKVTSEDQIEGAVNELDNLPIPITEYALFLQQEGDRRVTEARQTWEQEQSATGDDESYSEEHTEPVTTTATGKPTGKGKKPTKGGDDAISKLTATVAQLAQSITNMQKEGNQKTLTEQLHAKLGEKKIPLVFAKGRTVEKSEDLEIVLAEIEADYAEVKQGLNNDGLTNMSAPIGGTGGNVDKTKVEAEIKAWSQKQQPATNSQTDKK